MKDHGPVLAVCDAELLGKELEGVLLDEKFYKGEYVDKTALKERLKSARKIINAFGARTFAVLVELKLCEHGRCLKVGGAPHVQVMFL